jgi:hypothetical protein
MRLSMLGCGALAALALPLVAAATVVVGQSVEQMAKETPLIVRGIVGEQQARWDEDRRGISTWTQVAVKETLKGKAPEVLEVRQPGGEVGNIGAKVAGAARFKTGEEVLLFLEPPGDDPTRLVVRGMAAGKVLLAEDALGRKKATRDLRGLAFWVPGAEPVVREVGAEEDLGDADAFLRRIRTAIKRAGAAK